MKIAKTGKPLDMLRFAFDQANRIKGETLYVKTPLRAAAGSALQRRTAARPNALGVVAGARSWIARPLRRPKIRFP